MAAPKFKPPKWQERNRAQPLFATGLSDVQIARRLRVGRTTVRRWRHADGWPALDPAAAGRGERQGPFAPLGSPAAILAQTIAAAATMRTPVPPQPSPTMAPATLWQLDEHGRPRVRS